MKKMFKIKTNVSMVEKFVFSFLGILIGVFIGMVVVMSFYHPYINTSMVNEKPENVSVSAVLVNDCDGYTHYWMELVEIRNDTVRYKIYDRSGILIYDADFVYEDSYDIYLTKTNWTHYVDSIYLDGDIKINLRNSINNLPLGYLIPVLPVYYMNWSNIML
ncbi:MAG: hypothetical protein ACPKM0_07855 [Pleomorphochaeta sp.]